MELFLLPKLMGFCGEGESKQMADKMTDEEKRLEDEVGRRSKEALMWPRREALMWSRREVLHRD